MGEEEAIGGGGGGWIDIRGLTTTGYASNECMRDDVRVLGAGFAREARGLESMSRLRVSDGAAYRVSDGDAVTGLGQTLWLERKILKQNKAISSDLCISKLYDDCVPASHILKSSA